MSNRFVTLLQFYLVWHPKIHNFSWNRGHTIGSTPEFLVFVLFAYVTLSLLLPRIPFAPPEPYILKLITALHSLTLFLLSFIMAIGCILSILLHSPPIHAVCFPINTAPSGPLFFWAYVFYLSKFLEFGDTLLIIVSRSFNRLTFLHVYHHATVLVMCFIWLETSQSLFPVALITNALVHVVMYYYYFCCALGNRPRWKKLVTNVQIVQFIFSFVISGWMLYKHFFGEGCSGIEGWYFNALFNASLFGLFVDFHSKSYKKSKVPEGNKKSS